MASPFYWRSPDGNLQEVIHLSMPKTSNNALGPRRVNWQKVAVILAFGVVPVFLLILFTYIPFAKMIQFSFYNMSYTKNKGFVGWDNYLKVFSKSEYVDAMLLSLYYMAGAVIQLSLALFFASVLSLEKIRGAGFFKSAMFFPFLVNGIAIGYIFKYFYTRGFVLDSVLQAVGIPLEKLPYWLRDQSVNNWSLVFTSLWKYCGQNMVLFIGAIASIDPTLYEAATIDGANRWQQFCHQDRVHAEPDPVHHRLAVGLRAGLRGRQHGGQRHGYVLYQDPPDGPRLGQGGPGLRHGDGADGPDPDIHRRPAPVLPLRHEGFRQHLQREVEQGQGAVVREGRAMMNANTSVTSSDTGARVRRGIVKALEYLALIFASFVALLPIVSSFMTSFKSADEYAATNAMTRPRTG